MRRSAAEQTEVDVDMADANTANVMEELITEEGPNTQPPQTLPLQIQAQFSLAPAIYTPFQGFDDLLDSDDGDHDHETQVDDAGNVIQLAYVTRNPTEEATEKLADRPVEKVTEQATNKATEKSGQDSDNVVNEAGPDKLEIIVAKIKRHQEIVKDNMLYLTEIHLRNLQNQAQHQVEQLESGNWGDENSNTTQKDDEREEKLTRKVWERLSGNALDEEASELGEFRPGRDMDSEIMEGYRNFEMVWGKSRAVKVMYEELNREVTEVIEGATLEVGVYGEHAEENLERYKSILVGRITEIKAEDPSMLMGTDKVMGGVETTRTAAEAEDSILSPAIDFGSTHSPSPAKAFPLPKDLTKIAVETSISTKEKRRDSDST